MRAFSLVHVCVCVRRPLYVHAYTVDLTIAKVLLNTILGWMAPRFCRRLVVADLSFIPLKILFPPFSFLYSSLLF